MQFLLSLSETVKGFFAHNIDLDFKKGTDKLIHNIYMFVLINP